MKIGDLASRTGTTTKTIRYYESVGLMKEPERTASGYRDYTTDAVDRLRFIRDAKATGLSLTEIQSVLELKDAGAGSCEHTQDLLARQLRDIDSQIERLQNAREELSQLADRAQLRDPQACTDPNRCRVIESRERPS